MVSRNIPFKRPCCLSLSIVHAGEMDERSTTLASPGTSIEGDKTVTDASTPVSNHYCFDAIDFIALYRIAERETFRDPSNQYWSSRLREAQAVVVEHVQRNGPSETLDEESREALDLFVCVLEKEGMSAFPLQSDRIH